MRVAGTLIVLLTSVVVAGANPVPLFWRGTYSESDSTWSIKVSEACTLRWDDVVFTAPLEFSFREDTLRINGTPVHTDRSPGWIQAPTLRSDDIRVDEFATEAELEEWVNAHGNREILADLRETDGSVTIISTPSVVPNWDLIISNIRSSESFSLRMWMLVANLARELELGGPVGIQDGAVSLDSRRSTTRDVRASSESSATDIDDRERAGNSHGGLPN